MSDKLAPFSEMLDRVVAVRIPEKIRRGTGEGEDRVPLPSRQKIEELESYLLLTAEARQLAESARLAVHRFLFDARIEADGMQGWEMHLGVAASKATAPQIEAAKKKANPRLVADIAEADFLVKRLTEQIKRLEHDDEVASRVYTLITGG